MGGKSLAYGSASQAQMAEWVFLVMIFVHPGSLPTGLIYGPYPTKAVCEKARWALQIRNIPNFYVQGCEEFRGRKVSNGSIRVVDTVPLS